MAPEYLMFIDADDKGLTKDEIEELKEVFVGTYITANSASVTQQSPSTEHTLTQFTCWILCFHGHDVVLLVVCKAETQCKVCLRDVNYIQTLQIIIILRDVIRLHDTKQPAA